MDPHDLDLALSDTQSRGAAPRRRQPARDAAQPSTMPSTRRGSLMPTDAPLAQPTKAKGRTARLRELNLFHFDLRELVKDVLLTSGNSQVSYHEYAAFSPPESDPGGDPRSPSLMGDGEDGRRMFHKAMMEDHKLDIEGNFNAEKKGHGLLQGRMRQIITNRRIFPRRPHEEMFTPDGLTLTVEDYESLGLHMATLPSIQRTTVEATFWNSKRDTIDVIISYSDNPQPPYDFLSMKYSLRTKTGTALIRRSFDTRWHADDALDEYERRLDSCRAQWAHPLVLPVVLLQVQLLRTEEEIVANNKKVNYLEGRVDLVTGTPPSQTYQQRQRRANIKPLAEQGRRPSSFAPIRRLTSLRDTLTEKVTRKTNGSYSGTLDTHLDEDYTSPQTIHLMKEAHNVLKESIQLLDTMRWMERAVKLLTEAGDEMEIRFREIKEEDEARRRSKNASGAGETVPEESGADENEDLSHDWHEIRQYLDCIWRLCTGLETERRISELRCRAQIDIIYSKMAQEDNNLNARMAVASTRDSSSMKALAVITAVFLPGEYIGTLFGVSMFNWQQGTAGDPAISEDAPVGWPMPTIMPSFWVYWAFTIPLTLFIVTGWRAWWVNQDRYFRRHLSSELSNEKFWTTDGKPRELGTTFMQDFFSLFSRSGARSSSNSAVLGANPTPRRSTFGPGISPQPSAEDGRVSRGHSGNTWPMSRIASVAKDREVTDSEGEAGGRFRRISFLGQVGPPPAAHERRPPV